MLIAKKIVIKVAIYKTSPFSSITSIVNILSDYFDYSALTIYFSCFERKLQILSHFFQFQFKICFLLQIWNHSSNYVKCEQIHCFIQ